MVNVKRVRTRKINPNQEKCTESVEKWNLAVVNGYFVEIFWIIYNLFCDNISKFELFNQNLRKKAMKFPMWVYISH